MADKVDRFYRDSQQYQPQMDPQHYAEEVKEAPGQAAQAEPGWMDRTISKYFPRFVLAYIDRHK